MGILGQWLKTKWDAKRDKSANDELRATLNAVLIDNTRLSKRVHKLNQELGIRDTDE